MKGITFADLNAHGILIDRHYNQMERCLVYRFTKGYSGLEIKMPCDRLEKCQDRLTDLLQEVCIEVLEWAEKIPKPVVEYDVLEWPFRKDG